MRPISRRMFRLASVAALTAAPFATSGPSGATTPLTCSANCTVRADTNTGYVSPVIEVANGTEVSWLPSTTSHPTGESQVADPCFLVAVGATVTPAPVVFASSASGVTATVNAVTKPCTGAQPLSDSAWAVTYNCKLHFWMNGTVVVDR